MQKMFLAPAVLWNLELTLKDRATRKYGPSLSKYLRGA